MADIVTRLGKGSPLTWIEADSNFTNLNTDKIETSEIGVSVQPYSANLVEFATVNPTAAGLALLDDTDAAAQRTTLGLGNVDNTSDATKNSATATLTNKTLTQPKIKAGQFGDSGTATNNFTITAEAADGTMKIARGNAGATTQDVMVVDSDGKVSFPVLAQSFTTNGYAKLPGGLIIQWGDFPGADASGLSSVSFPISFTNNVLQATVTHVAGARNSVVVNITSLTSTSIQIGCSLSNTGAAASGASAKFIAVGY